MKILIDLWKGMAGISNSFSIYIAGGRIISMFAGFIMPVVLVRIMTKEEYGLTSQFLTLYTSIYTIAAFGIHTSLFFFCPSSDKHAVDKYITNTLFLLFVFGFLMGFVLLIPPITNLVFGDSELGRHSKLIILSISLATTMNIVSPLNTIRQDKWGALLFPGFVAFMRIGAIVYSALVFRDITQMFFWLFVFQSIISFAIILYTHLETTFSLSFRLMKEQVLYSLPFGLSVALQLLSNYFDEFVCIKLLSPTEYAIYGVAFLSIPGITQIYDSLCQVNIVNMSNSFRTGKTHDIITQYGFFVVKTLSFSVPIILIVSLYAEEIIIFLYTSSYEPAAPFFRLYSLTFLTSMFGAGTILRSMGKTRLSFYAFLTACVIGLPTTYFLVYNYGTVGAIWGAVINIMLPRLIQMGMEIRILHSGIKDFLPWKKIACIFGCSSILLIPFVIMKYFFCFNIWITIVEGLVYVLFSFFVLISMDLFIIDKKTIRLFLSKVKCSK